MPDGGQIGTVGGYRAEGDDGPETDVDLGGGDLAPTDHMPGAGDDSPPLAEDYVALIELDGVTEQLAAVGYSDATDKVAAPGEKRIYARDSAGVLKAEVHIKGDGEIVVKQTAGSSITIAASGAVTIAATSVSFTVGQDLGTHFGALHAALAAWVVVPTDGGAALKTALAAYLLQVPPGP